MADRCSDPDPICTYQGDIDPGEHDARCDVWISDDPTECTCRDDMGHRPREHDEQPTRRAPARDERPCDTDPADQRAGA